MRRREFISFLAALCFGLRALAPSMCLGLAILARGRRTLITCGEH